MGTRAQFFIGNPSDVANRDWLGCTAWDGYPDGYCGKAFANVETAEQFMAAVDGLKTRDDFCDPMNNSFPFPWRNDLYLTDYTYAFFDGRMQVTCYHGGWRDLRAVLAADDDAEVYDGPDELPGNVPAPDAKGPAGPDSIIIITSI